MPGGQGSGADGYPLPEPRVLVRQVQVTGNTLFSKEALAAVTAAYVNHHVTSEELEELRLA